MKPVKCCECGRRRERCRPVARLASGQVDVVCPQCWVLHDYEEFVRWP